MDGYKGLFTPMSINASVQTNMSIGHCWVLLYLLFYYAGLVFGVVCEYKTVNTKISDFLSSPWKAGVKNKKLYGIFCSRVTRVFLLFWKYHIQSKSESTCSFSSSAVFLCIGLNRKIACKSMFLSQTLVLVWTGLNNIVHNYLA